MRSHCLHHGIRFAKRSGLFETDLRMQAAQLVEQQRNVTLQMTSCRNKHRQYNDALKAFGDQGSSAIVQIGRKEVEESKLCAQFGRLSTHQCTNAAQRQRPFGIARTVGKENQGGF